MDVNLSMDEDLVRRAREYAREHDTTLDQLVCDCLERLVGDMTPAEAAEEFCRIAMTYPGHSPPGSRFNRNSIHRYDEEAG